MPRRRSDDRGASLVEVLVAVVVLGTAALAAVGGLFTSIRVSDVHRDQTTAAAVARDYSERIAGAPDLNCASAAGTYASLAGQVDIPAGYTAAVGPIESRTGSAWGACVTGELQRVTVEVSSVDGVSERSVVVVRAP
jgi:prepilin-type N-terminal cleavage/methylation domain-containing protein